VQIKALEDQIAALQVKARTEMDKEKEEKMKAVRELQHRNFVISNQLDVRCSLVEDEVLKLKQDIVDAAEPSAREPDSSSSTLRYQCATLDHIEHGLNNLRAYLSKQRELADQLSGNFILPDHHLELDQTIRTTWTLPVSEQCSLLVQKIENGISFVKQRVTIKCTLEAKLGPQSPALLIHQYHYEQFLYYLQHLLELVRYAMVDTDASSDQHARSTLRRLSHYAPHLIRIYNILASIVLKSVESLAQIDDSLSVITSSTMGTPLDMNTVYLQLKQMQDTIKQLRASSTETIDKLMQKNQVSKTKIRRLEASLKQWEQKKTLQDLKIQEL
jgi:hypothetical protein